MASIDQQLDKVKRELSDDLRQIQAKTRSVFSREVYSLHGWIITNYFSRTSERGLSGGLHSRSGTARRGWVVKISQTGQGRDMSLQGSINNGVSYVPAHLKDHTIRPKAPKKWLAIPTENAKTRAGVPRYSGPRDPKAPEMKFIPKKGSNDTAFLFAKKGQGIPKRRALLYVLKKKVFVPGRLHNLLPQAKQRASQIGRKVLKEISGI